MQILFLMVPGGVQIKLNVKIFRNSAAICVILLYNHPQSKSIITR